MGDDITINNDFDICVKGDTLTTQAGSYINHIDGVGAWRLVEPLSAGDGDELCLNVNDYDIQSLIYKWCTEVREDEKEKEESELQKLAGSLKPIERYKIKHK